MRALAFLIPGRFDTRTGGYEYDRHIADGLAARGWQVDIRQLDDSFPRATANALQDAGEVLASLPDNATVLIDGLACGAMPDLVAHEASRLRLVALVHHPLAFETGLDDSTVTKFVRSESRALAGMRRVVVTSRATASSLDRYGVDPARISVVSPGTEPAPLAVGSGAPRLELISVGSVIPRKNHHTLVAALAAIADLPWHLTVVGSLDRDPETAARLREQIERCSLEPRVTLAGEAGQEALDAYYHRSDVFVLPTFYEGYGMVVAEALARGIPIVSSPTGAIPHLVGDDAGVLVPPADTSALADVLAYVLTDQAFRSNLKQGASAARARLPTWEASVALMATILEDVAEHEHVRR